MKEKKDQFVIAYLADLDNPDTVLTHAVALARMLGKGLILLHISDPRYTDLTPTRQEAGCRHCARRCSQTASEAWLPLPT
jgi:nucleotide-binding universal stress UspA family protein